MQANHDALREEVTALKTDRSSRPNTPSHTHVSHNEFGWEREVEGEVEDNGFNANYGDRFGEGNYNMNGFGGGVGGRRFGNGHGVNGQNGGRGPWNQDRRDNLEHRYVANREERQEPRYEDPTKSIKHTLPEFHGKYDPATSLEWLS